VKESYAHHRVNATGTEREVIGVGPEKSQPRSRGPNFPTRHRQHLAGDVGRDHPERRVQQPVVDAPSPARDIEHDAAGRQVAQRLAQQSAESPVVVPAAWVVKSLPVIRVRHERILVSDRSGTPLLAGHVSSTRVPGPKPSSSALTVLDPALTRQVVVAPGIEHHERPEDLAVIAPPIKVLGDEPCHRRRFKKAPMSHPRRRQPRLHDFP
jgi:hypothetical protein